MLGLDAGNDPFPLEAYDIGCDEGAWDHFTRKMWCGAQAWFFSIGKWAIGLGIDLMGWALEFRIAEGLAPAAGALSRVYETSLIGPLNVRTLAWALALLVAGWHVMRARAARGAAEIATTILITSLGSFVLINPQGYLEGSIEAAENTSGSVLEAVDGAMHGTAETEPEVTAESIRDRLGDVMRRSFVAEPYDRINWGPDELSGECAAARDEILADGPWGSDDEPREIMRSHGCDAQAEFNAEPTDTRAAGSAIVGLTAVLATVLLAAVALIVVVAQLTLVAMFAGASLVWALALAPGARDLLWWWLGRLFWAIAACIAATFILSWLAVTTAAMLEATSDMDIIQRSLLTLLLFAVAFRLRGQLGRVLDQASRRIGDRLSRMAQQPNRSPALSGTGPGGAAGGFGLARTARNWGFDLPGGQYAYNWGYARHFTRGYRRHHRGGGPIRRALRRFNRFDKRATQAGGNVARSLGRAAKTTVMAPVLGPQAYAKVRNRATAASGRARTKLEQARATRKQWVRNVAHPVKAMQDVRRQAPTREAGSRAVGSALAPATQRQASSTLAKALGRARQMSTETHEQVRVARALHRDRAREAGHLFQGLVDLHREPKDVIPPSPNPPQAPPPPDEFPPKER